MNIFNLNRQNSIIKFYGGAFIMKNNEKNNNKNNSKKNNSKNNSKNECE